ncbi:oxidoreductase [candidate division KSB3 bacterium]|uniref:Oxidoreductase n=1 Tax=candidate division KSB3 bacterium TaxID=2044937 RepID=A0A2G6K9V0_9BACT|nr:MAG: oxidoreductase [candidate division KSB3 bacterium]
MNAQKTMKLAVIGLGVMGRQHTKDIHALDNAELVAVCDVNKAAADELVTEYGVKAYYDYQSLFRQVELDGVIIATPHYDHTPISIQAFQRGIHVLVEKPISVHAKDATHMITAYKEAQKQYPNLVFAAMFMQRTYGYWKKIKSMIDEGELGKLVRTTWIATNWFRSQTYYDNGGWRATWKGEGGGVLLNQCPHNLDLYQWFVGMPKRVTGFASIGKYHNIEVEDEVTAYFEYENGMVGHFMTTTAESPGTNRLEIVGEHGKLVFEDEKLTFYKNDMSMLEKIETATSMFDKTEHEVLEISYDHHGDPGHKFVIENFINAVLQGEELIAPATEGLNSVMLGNAILLSSFRKKTVDIPIDEDAYEKKLQEQIANSEFQKIERTIDANEVNIEDSFN